jgi:hypothetical protein
MTVAGAWHTPAVLGHETCHSPPHTPMPLTRCLVLYCWSSRLDALLLLAHLAACHSSAARSSRCSTLETWNVPLPVDCKTANTAVPVALQLGSLAEHSKPRMRGAYLQTPYQKARAHHACAPGTPVWLHLPASASPPPSPPFTLQSTSLSQAAGCCFIDAGRSARLYMCVCVVRQLQDMQVHPYIRI